jgi:DNA-binding XRE family transcriptional regulator
MTQMDLAVRLGVSLSTVTNLESGRHQPRMELARKIADMFGVTIDSIEWPKVARPKKAATTASKG